MSGLVHLFLSTAFKDTSWDFSETFCQIRTLFKHTSKNKYIFYFSLKKIPLISNSRTTLVDLSDLCFHSASSSMLISIFRIIVLPLYFLVEVSSDFYELPLWPKYMFICWQQIYCQPNHKFSFDISLLATVKKLPCFSINQIFITRNTPFKS